MENNTSLEEQNTDFKKPMNEAQWQRLKNISLEVAVLGGLLGGVLAVVGVFLAVSGLSFGVIVEQIGGYTLFLSVLSPIWIGIYAFFRYRKRRE